MIFGPAGDAFLARGMKQAGAIDIHHLSRILSALSNPYVVLGIILLLICMSSYMSALSFADLSYIMPATAISYVVMVLLSIVWLHEHVGQRRWTGVAFIVLGVATVAGGPARTAKPLDVTSESKLAEERV